ncbi:P-loop containing nucleoside triphosphate hydrolase protein, partial [Gaertneriomyces semiglobifer]
MLETPNIQTFAPYESQPECVKNGELKPYQIEGLDWLLYKWLKREGAILADDMGLGKTVQIVALLTSLWSDYRKGPFLICAPSSTVGHWAQELQKWSASELCVVNYRDEETRPKRLKRGKNVRCHVVISNYETFLRDDGLAEIAWDAMVCDEGHRLKSDQAKTFTALSRMKVEWKVLLTGTPLQNNLRELFNLLSFLDPSAFNDPVAWENKYGDKELKDDTCVPDLHAALKPYILRRTKDDERVQLNLPPKREYFVPVELTAAQKELYKSVLSKNADLMKAIGVTLSGSSDARLKSLQNLLMELRKICNHPYCFTGIPEYDYTKGMREEKFKEMVDIGGKLALLDRMLPKLQERGHRVLLFSQFRMTLDVLEEYVKGKGWRWARMDGHTPIEVRQPLINAFNSPDSDIFVLLLTTRTGGEGINLTAADTIILYDADWNPHRDIQAMSRVHRIGQQRPVMVYRFFSRGTAEEKILEVGKKKLVLDWMIIEGMK